MKKPWLSRFDRQRRVAAAWLLGGGLLALSAATALGDSLWEETGSKSMFADKRASAVGDLLTVVVLESNSASKDKNAKTSKKSSLDASVATFLYSPAASGLLTKNGQMPAIKLNSKSDFEGGGAVNNSEEIKARFAVRVIDVLPNRNLVIEGTRETAFSGEQQTIVLRGVVRPDDITSNNSVLSANISEATIKFISKGVLTDSQRKGWLQRVWDKVAPF